VFTLWAAQSKATVKNCGGEYTFDVRQTQPGSLLQKIITTRTVSKLMNDSELSFIFGKREN
jgi:hypothetical protein